MKKLLVVLLLLITAGGVYYYLTYEPTKDNNPTNPEVTASPIEVQQNKQIVIFHNGTGPMCIEALDFFEKNELEYTEYLNTEADFQNRLSGYLEKFDGKSEGVSDSFSYYPIIFVGTSAFSGFDENVGLEILNSLSQ